MKPMHQPASAKEKLYSKTQEALRKDMGRAFGVIKSKWKIIEQPRRLWSRKMMSDIMKAVIILHNMIVEERGRDALCEEALEEESGRSSLSSSRLGGYLPMFWKIPSCSSDLAEPPSGSIAAMFAVAAMIENEKEHSKTKQLLINHLWNEKGRSFS